MNLGTKGWGGREEKAGIGGGEGDEGFGGRERGRLRTAKKQGSHADRVQGGQLNS